MQLPASLPTRPSLADHPVYAFAFVAEMRPQFLDFLDPNKIKCATACIRKAGYGECVARAPARWPPATASGQLQRRDRTERFSRSGRVARGPADRPGGFGGAHAPHQPRAVSRLSGAAISWLGPCVQHSGRHGWPFVRLLRTHRGITPPRWPHRRSRASRSTLSLASCSRTRCGLGFLDGSALGIAGFAGRRDRHSFLAALLMTAGSSAAGRARKRSRAACLAAAAALIRSPNVFSL